MGGRWWSLLAVILAGCMPRAPSRTIRFESTVDSARLGNGMRVLVIEDHDTNLVSLGVRLDVGSSDDPPGKAGLAHLVEHLMFQLQSQPDRRPILAHLTAVALAFNAYTSTNTTHYVSVARADQVDALLQVEGRRFSAACASLSEAAFEREREVVRNELRLRSSLGVDSALGLVLYPPEHPYARPIGGTDASVARLTLDDACRFIQAHYQPDRMVVVLTGDIDARAAIRTVGRTLGRLAGHSRGHKPPWEIALPSLRRVQADLRRAGGPAIVVEWPMPASWAPEYPAASIALELVQAALRAHAVVLELGDPRARLAVAVIRQRAAPDDAAVARTLDDVDRAIARASSMTRDEMLDPIIDRHARQLLSTFDQLSARVELMAAPFQLAGDDHVVVRQLVRYDHLDGDDVRAAISRTFARERRSVVVVTPPRSHPAAADALLPSYAGRSHEEDWHAPVDPGEADRRLRMPLPRDRLRRAERFRLSNGLTVILLRTQAAPLVSARLVFAGGSADDPPGKEGVATSAARLLRIRNRGSELVYSLVASSNVGVGADDTTFAAQGLSSHVDAVIAALAARVVDGEYRARDLDARSRASAATGPSRESAGERTAKERSRARDRLRVGLYSHLFGEGHPYARVERSAWAGGGPRLVTADLEAVRDRRFAARNGVLVLCGQFDPALVREQIEYRFADLRAGAPYRPSRPPPRPSAGVVTEWTDAADPTATLTIGFPTGGDRAGRAARMVIAAMVSERMHRLRAAYAMDVEQDDHPGAGGIVITALVDTTRSGEAMKLMIEEIARLRAGDRDLADAFVRARRQVLQGIVAEDSGADRSAARIASLIAGGDDLGSSAGLARQVMELTMGDVRSALAAELDASRQVTALLGPPDSVTAARSVIEDAREHRSGVSPPTQ